MSKTFIVLNPHAGSGRAGQLWKVMEPMLWEMLGELVVAITDKPEEVAQHLDKAYASGLRRVISIGGDGTNHALINALAGLNEQHPQEEHMVYGMLPVGTGRDWARGVGIPTEDIHAAARWIAEAQPHPTDIGLLTYDGQQQHFLNIASAGIGGEVVSRVNQTPVRKPWTFLKATVTALLKHKPQPMQIMLDNNLWYEGKAYIVAVANGTTFGHGMKIAPHAQIHDGLFDVVMLEGISRFRVLAALMRVYNGAHLTHPAIRAERAAHVEITSKGSKLGLELDGEYASGQHLAFSVRPGLLQILD